MTGTLVIVRHGESTWNQENLFTGWHDVPLTDRGRAEASAAGATMRDAGLWFDVGHTSVLTRAVATANLALDALGQPWLPVQRNWRLNERHYGALQGLDKAATTQRHGAEQTQLWRRSYDVPPPPIDITDPEHPRTDRRYRLLPPDVLPATECLKDVVARVLPYWHDAIVPQLRAELDVLVVAHGNSLRALVKHLEGISDEDIAALNIPTGAPRRYELDDELRVVVGGLSRRRRRDRRRRRRRRITGRAGLATLSVQLGSATVSAGLHECPAWPISPIDSGYSPSRIRTLLVGLISSGGHGETRRHDDHRAPTTGSTRPLRRPSAVGGAGADVGEPASAAVHLRHGRPRAGLAPGVLRRRSPRAHDAPELGPGRRRRSPSACGCST